MQKNKKIFFDVVQYMEQMLYSFQSTGKVLLSLKETSEIFKPGDMKNTIDKASEEIMYGNQEDIIRCGLRIIEDKYFCRKLSLMHDFLAKAEEIGGNYTDYIDLLLEQRSLWIERISQSEKEKLQKQRSIILSILVSMLICLFVEKMIPNKLGIESTIIYQISGITMFVINILCCLFMLKKLSSNPISEDDNLQSEGKKCLDYVKEYSYKKIIKKSSKYMVVFLSLLICGIIFLKSAFIISGVFVMAIILLRPPIMYRSKYKRLVKELDISYCSWLIEMSLIMQNTTVQDAIMQSASSAPLVLLEPLEQMIFELKDDPTSKKPYLNFLSEFDLPHVHSSMKMLSSISSGSGSNAQEQIKKLLHQNNIVNDKALRLRADDRLAGLYALFLAPQISAGVKLIPDLMMFLLLFLATTKI